MWATGDMYHSALQQPANIGGTDVFWCQMQSLFEGSSSLFETTVCLQYTTKVDVTICRWGKLQRLTVGVDRCRIVAGPSSTLGETIQNVSVVWLQRIGLFVPWHGFGISTERVEGQSHVSSVARQAAG